MNDSASLLFCSTMDTHDCCNVTVVTKTLDWLAGARIS